MLTLDATKWQFTTTYAMSNRSVRTLRGCDSHCWTVPGNQEIQLALFYSYGSNPPLYPQWQEFSPSPHRST